MSEDFTVSLYQNYSGTAVTTSGLDFEVVRYSHSAIGGPFTAEIRVTGGELELWKLLNRAGDELKIHCSKTGDYVWWGYVHDVEVTAGKYQAKVSMDSLANRVRVVYPYMNVGGGGIVSPAGFGSARRESDWIFDGNSIEAYGLKEITYSTNGADASFARQLQRKLLEKFKLPRVTVTQVRMATKTASATLKCRGWWETLDWRYLPRKYATDACREFGAGGLEFGGGAGSVVKIAQSYIPAGTMIPRQLNIGIYKVGSPTDNITAAIYTDSGGTPISSVLSFTSYAGTALTAGTFTWPAFRYAGTVAVNAGSTYWIVLDRDGADSSTDYYVADLTFQGNYASGQMKYYTGSAWTTASVPPADMPFSVTGEVMEANEDSATQIKRYIEDYGVIVPLSSAVIIDSSGISANPYRERENTALYEIEELLELGTSNNRRLLTKVRKDRVVEIYEEPAATEAGYFTASGDIHNSGGGPMLKETCPCAIWLDLSGVIPEGVLGAYLSPDKAMFVERAEYVPKTKELRITPAEVVTEFDFMVVRNE